MDLYRVVPQTKRRNSWYFESYIQCMYFNTLKNVLQTKTGPNLLFPESQSFSVSVYTEIKYSTSITKGPF